MNDEPEDRRSDADSDIEREIRQSRKITAKDVMAQLAGPGAMKGASPVSPVQQAETEIGNWLGMNLQDGCGQLRVVVYRNIKGSERLLESLDRPLAALAQYLREVLANDNLLKEIVPHELLSARRAPNFAGSLVDPNRVLADFSGPQPDVRRRRR